MDKNMVELALKDEVHAVIGAAIEVHKHLGHGFLIVEIKALKQLTSADEAQLLNYLKATGLKVSLLINFGASGKLEWKRFVL